MDLWKQTACRLAHVAGLTRALDRDSGVRILTYHSVIPGCATGFLESQRVDLFRAQMQYLCARFDVVPLEQALAMRPAARPQGRPVVAVTFDDGFADNYSYAFPVVRELAVPVTIFLATDFLDGERAPWPTRLREVIMTTRKLMHPAYPDLDLSSQEGRRSAAAKLKGALAKLGPLERLETVERLARDWDAGPSRCHPLTWDQVRKMADAEICFGSHTVFHSILTDASETVIAMELSRSKQRIESELGRQCSAIAYPNGNHDERVRHIAEACGYRIGLTQDQGTNRAGTEHLALRRVHVPPDFTESALAVVLLRAGWQQSSADPERLCAYT